MAESKNWRDGVRVVRGQSLDAIMRDPSGTGRATAFNFAGTGGQRTWVGTATGGPGSKTGTHNHGHHEVMVYVVAGHSEIRWGERLEYVADIGPGDFAYFAPFVPHQERNPSDTEPFVFLVVRSDGERIAVKLDEKPVERPERVY